MPFMHIYIHIACDRLEENQETKLKENLPNILVEMQKYADSTPQANVVVINENSEEDCENWVLGIEQTVKKNKQLQAPINLFNGLAKQFSLDIEIGSIEKDQRSAVCYFGTEEGRGDSYMIAQYLGL